MRWHAGRCRHAAAPAASSAAVARCTPRVVRSHETVSIRRHLTKETETVTTDWLWVTTLPRDLAPTKAVVELGHSRWAIGNHGFNQLVNEWHAAHVYTHDATAIEAFWLMTMFAYNHSLSP